MKIGIEELDYQRTHLGELVLRKRYEPRLDGKLVHEVLLNDEWLMSSLFTEGEEALARLALSPRLPGAAPGSLSVVVGGLGLGYTAAAVLDSDAVGEVLVIDTLAEVIGWHQRGLVPVGERLATDPRCRLVQGDFFALASGAPTGFDRRVPDRRFDVIALDIDHAPNHWLHPTNAAFYTPEALGAMARQLSDGGVFALWSNNRPDDDFTHLLACVFGGATAHEVAFANPYSGDSSANSVYVASTAAASGVHPASSQV